MSHIASALESHREQRNLSHEEESLAHLLQDCNVDGDDLRQTWKYAFGTNQSPELIAKWDKLSCQDRLDQIRDQLSAEEVSVLQAQLMQMSGNTLDKMGLVGVLRWWVLGSHTPTGLNDIALRTRLGSGNSELHCRIFEHALSTENLSYGFSVPVQRIEDAGDIVTVTTRDGKTWKARSVIFTVPLNVLASVKFSPRLPADKVAALQQQSVNRCNKVHVDMDGPDYLSWGSMATLGKGLMAALGDHLTPVNDTHLVYFGPDPECSTGISLDNLDTVKAAVVHLLPGNKQDEAVINRIVSHDWNKDEFATGTWSFPPPNATTKYISVLQRPHGNLFFASADWSDGWCGWIDGAVQSGMQTARQVILEQRKAAVVKKNVLPKGPSIDLSKGIVRCVI
ncbi:Flavin amine oxidase [Penicillium cf. viridicatum]|uniref:Amine oxidase n=1 Tax=Penicillium cf. viridicatum TaxID=2972119 RepID=A0A9W9M3A4_9EURO|nr:Flavin amine oxidase [Penicillium cf. viridicatum]